MQTLSLKPRGLQRYPNQLSKAEPGSLATGKNAVMVRDDVIELRRGLKQFGTQLSFIAGQKVNKFYDFQNALIASYKDKLALDSDGLGTWSDYSGTFSPPSGAAVMRSIQANKNLYLTTDAGIKKLESTTSAWTTAGMPRALDGNGATSGVAGWMNNDTQVAYRVIWGIKDANENLILGAPSQRIIVVNSSGGTRDVDLTISIPADITTGHFFQVYRSAMSATAAVSANDELGLVFEASPTAGEITSLSLTFTDITPEDLRGATLYTSPSQQGIGQANDQPPFCRDMVNFKGFTLYANTTGKHRFFLTLVSVDGTGLVVGNTVEIGGVLYTGAVAEDASLNRFLVDTSGTPAENIENTALSLVRVVNASASNTTLYAYYLSGFNDLPGKILFEERGIGGAAFAAVSSNGSAFNPVLPTSGTAQSSTNSRNKNGIAISKSQQPEAVPALNILFAGSADKEILRIIALRDSVFILKEDGVFRFVGSSLSDFSLSLFDGTVEIKGDETAVPFNNQVFAFSNQGVIGISETGVSVVSRPIEGDLFTLSALANFSATAFAVPYESERSYLIFTVGAASDTFPVQAYVFNLFTNAWMGPWPVNVSAGIVKAVDDKLYLGFWTQTGPYPRYVRQERKAFTVDDYADEDFPFNVVSVAADGVTLTVSSTTNLLVNDKIKQNTRTAIITSIVDGTHLVVDRQRAWRAAAATAYRAIPVDVQMVPEFAQNPGILKHWPEVSFMFEKAQFKSIALGFATDLSTGYENVTGHSRAEGPFGRFPFGGVPFGGGVPPLQPIRCYPPRRKQRGSLLKIRLQHQEALSRFAYAGVSLQFEPMSSRMH